MKSFYPKQNDPLVSKKWVLVDLNGLTVGRAATQIAHILRGKNKPTFTPSADVGDFVVAINSDGLKLTGNKLEDKIYYRHTGHMGGIKEITAKKQMIKDSTKVLEKAVQGMLPKGVLGRKVFSKLKIFKNAEHTHAAQTPVAITLPV